MRPKLQIVRIRLPTLRLTGQRTPPSIAVGKIREIAGYLAHLVVVLGSCFCRRGSRDCSATTCALPWAGGRLAMARAGAVRARNIARTVAAVPLSSRGPPEPRCCSTVVTVKTVAFLVLHRHFTTSPENANVANHRSQLQSNGTQEAWPVISLRLLTTGSLSTATKLTNSQKFLLRYTMPKHGRLHRKRLRKLQSTVTNHTYHSLALST